MNVKAEKILVIDDDPDQQNLMGMYIQKMGHLAEFASTADEGLKKARDHHPDLILLDIILPDEAGLIVLNQLKDDVTTKDIPVIIITSLTDDDIAIAALASGASDILTKPVKNAQLIPRIQKVFEIAEYQAKLIELNKKLELEKKSLSRYFPDNVVKQIIQGEIQPSLGGQITEATIMFLNLRNAAQMVEILEPELFVQTLNLFFTDVFEIIFANQGSVNKMLGDGLLATFGCPIKSPQDPDNCVQAALKIQKQMEILNQNLPESMPIQIHLGIGITTGNVIAGNIGSQRLMEYTVIGDPVNLANRLEALTPKFESQILIDDTTQKKISPDFRTTFKSKGLLRGNHNVVEIYALDGISS